MPSSHPTASACWLILLGFFALFGNQPIDALQIGSRKDNAASAGRDVASLNAGWKFFRTTTNPDKLVYDKRSDMTGSDLTVLKSWILPSANDFIKDPAKQSQRPAGTAPGGNITFVQSNFDDSTWESLNLPHDWAAKGPFYTQTSPPVSGSLGRLPIQGIAWYRKKLTIDPADASKSFYLDIDGAMSYAMVWLNGNLVGGWPSGYASFRLDLTPYIKPGNDNQLAIRLDNPLRSSRWYPGGGIYRNVWLTKVDPTHVGHWGTRITVKDASAQSATVDITVQIENKASDSRAIEVATDIYILDSASSKAGEKVAEFPRSKIDIAKGQKQSVNATVNVKNPRLWGPHTGQVPNLYVAVTHLTADDKTIDTYETRFGIRSVTYDGNKGLLVNGEKVRIQGVNQHHDLGALGTAFNYRAAERQLEILREFGTNAIRTSHNPPAPELLDLADRMGFLILDEAFDCWEKEKNPNDYHLLFPDWSEADLRTLVRRDRNHPSVVFWSIGNEISEQGAGEAGAAIARRLRDIVHEEDPTRPVTSGMNNAGPTTAYTQAMDVMGLNYQGERFSDAYSNFHTKFPGKLIQSTETASTLSTRGEYVFPVTSSNSATVGESAGAGGDRSTRRVSSYDLYGPSWGCSPDFAFAAQDKSPFVAGEYVWSGFDYIGEPTPYDAASRSSYFGIVDLAGFKKDRFYLYQSRWRPDFKVAHILPHWTWPDRVGEVTPVHVYSSADEAELFLNGKSLGRKTKGASNFRFRWDTVTYEAGELRVITYKNGKEWANDTVRTNEAATKLRLTADRATIAADGKDLSYITAEVLDTRGDIARRANNTITFSISGPGEIVATDNGDPTDFVAFPSKERKALGGLALAIIRASAGAPGTITVTATAAGLEAAKVELKTQA